MDTTNPFLIPALETAIEVLQERLNAARGVKPAPAVKPVKPAVAVTRPIMSQEAREKIRAAQKLRWALHNKEKATVASSPAKKTTGKKKAAVKTGGPVHLAIPRGGEEV